MLWDAVSVLAWAGFSELVHAAKNKTISSALVFINFFMFIGV
jgi:hypothetical protein